MGKSLERVHETVSQVVKVFGRWDASLIEERLNSSPRGFPFCLAIIDTHGDISTC
jgi:hypothetical protein